ncbi:hypothetical protein, partial [Hungatella effluvii]
AFAVDLCQQQLLYLITVIYFCQPLFHFLQNFLSGSAGRFLEKFAAVFSGEVYYIKAADKSQHVFCFFSFF